MSNEANLGNLWDDLGWNVVYTHDVEPRQQQVFDVDELDLSDANKRFLREKFNGKIYGHQKETIRLAMTGQNVCMTTGTASGKSLPFYVTAIEHLVRNPSAKVVAIYPLKALGREQEDRWKQTLISAGLDKQIRVGRIDGSVKGKEARIKILKESRVLILTPDIIHHWLLLSPGQKDVKSLLKNLSLFIVDEVHTYTGVFGSNAAFLFRRVQHLMSILGASPKYVCASATIANPFDHLQKLFGLDFALVGSEFDTSPKNKVKTWLVNPPVVQDLLSNITELIDYLVQNTPSRIITFVDSRKMAEYVTTLLERIQNNDDTDDADSSEGETHGNLFANPLEHLNILPYRSGYEEQDAKVIQNRLSQGLARGVISTSALELGLDIPSLDVCILVGVPQSSTSFFQRIGRVGRHSEGNIIVINTGSISDEAIFSHPENLLKRPMAEGALYLENIRIQYIHALCLARQNGEHDQVFGKQGDIAFSSTVNWADGFVELCCKERLGEISADLQSMKLEAGDTPNHIFPLRDVESQFKITLKQGPDERDLGSVSYGQLMREAYPGAVYYHAARTYRSYRILTNQKIIQVRKEKRYTTKPQNIPTLVYPNFTSDNIYRSRKHSELIAVECNLQIQESIVGFKERRGSNEFNCNYPTNQSETGVAFDLPYFTRRYFSTGIILTHPVFNKIGVEVDKIANLAYEACLLTIPFEHRDIGYATDKHRSDRIGISKGDKFIAIYDQTYGSLRLSGRFLEEKVFREVFQVVVENIDNETLNLNRETKEAVKIIRESLDQEGINFSFEDSVILENTSERVKVICPKSRGINIYRNNEEFLVDKVSFHPSIPNELSYSGRHISNKDVTLKERIAVSHLVEIPGESSVGWYDYDSEEIEGCS